MKSTIQGVKKAVSYLRVSTGEQSLGIEAQRAQIASSCEA